MLVTQDQSYHLKLLKEIHTKNRTPAGEEDKPVLQRKYHQGPSNFEKAFDKVPYQRLLK